MAGKTLSYFNLTGGLNTVQTMATINATPNRTESPDMVNIEYFKLSGIRTMNGNVGLNSSNPINNDYNTNRINFGYEYIKGNDRYMIVADAQSLYEYNPFTDTFTTLISFETAGNGITMCGYANGVIAASPVNNYLIYYRKDRFELSLGTITTVANSNTASVTSTILDMLAQGDIVTVNDEVFEIESVDADNGSVTFTENATTAYTGIKFYLTDFTKIYCIYTSIVDDGNGGTTTTTINFLPKVVQSHQGRIWVGATIEGEQTAAYLIYSDLGNIHNAFEGGDASPYDAGYFAEFWEDTSDITAIGTWDKYIVCHKREHTYLIDTSNSDATTWNVQSYSEYTCDNQRGFVKANNGYYTYCSTVGGIYPMIQRTIYSAISQGAEASTKIRDTFLNLNNYALDEIYAVYHPYKKYIMFYLPMIGEEGSNNCYILDLQTKSWLHRRIPQRVTTAFEFDNKVYIGTAYGKVLEEFRGTNFDGQPINFSWKSPWFIWGGATNWTTTREFRVKMSQEGTNNFYIRNRRDGIEDYKQRTITNTSNQVSSLSWDAAVLTNDLNPDYVSTFTAYSYTGADNKTYYAFETPLRNQTPMHEYTAPLTSITLSLVGTTAAGALSYEDVGSSNNYDRAEWGTGTRFAFKYIPTIPQYLCYRSSKDSNIKAWVTNGVTNSAVVNVTDEKLTFYAFKGYGNSQLSNNILGVTNTTDRDALINGTKRNFKMYIKLNGKFTRTATVNGSTKYLFGGYGIVPVNINLGEEEYGVSWCNSDSYNLTQFYRNSWIALVSRSKNYEKNLKLNRLSSEDVSQSTGKEIWNGKTTRSGKTKTISSYSTNSIVINGVTYNRYTAGDEGSLADNGNSVTVFANTEKLTVGQKVYTDSSLTTEYGTVSSVSNNSYNISGRIFNPDSSQNSVGVDTDYYITLPSFPNIDSITYNGTYTGSFMIINPPSYLNPDETSNHYADSVKFLTDSVWANGRDDATEIYEDLTPVETTEGNTWVNTGQITKRFPIDRQYFQTLQIEFCGETEDQGIELYGFEVDGIQLTEVPW